MTAHQHLVDISFLNGLFQTIHNAGTDQFFIGWRDASAAFAGDGLLATYDEYLGIGINNVDGSIFAQHEIATAATSDDSGVNMGEGETRTLKSCINATTRVPTAFYTAAGGSTYTAVTLTNSGGAQTASVNMNPFISYLNAAGTEAGISINWFRITR